MTESNWPDLEEANREMKRSADWHKVQPISTPPADGSKKCKHCGNRIIWMEFGWRPRWMHSSESTGSLSDFDSYEFCHMTAAEPEDELLAPSPTPLGSAQCSKCGRFRRIVSRTDGMNPDYKFIIHCPDHGQMLA